MTSMTIAGGVYREMVMWPSSDEVFGSAGRAACSIAQTGVDVELYGYADAVINEAIAGQAQSYGFRWHPTLIDRGVRFHYIHGLATPSISNWSRGAPALDIQADRVLRYGMLEGSAQVRAKQAVYDPQNTYNPEWFRANGSTSEHLAIVLNEHEASTLLGRKLTAEEAIAAVAGEEKAEVVVLKRGPRGALVFDKNGVHSIPAFETIGVSKIGSGDQFAAQFARAWMIDGLSAPQAAMQASKATAFYCERGQFPSRDELENYEPVPLLLGERWLTGYRAKVYLAGPFFTLAQLWMIEEARTHLRYMGLEVFSPYHDIGPGPANIVVPADLMAIESCDFVFAVGDGLDSGTVYEIGYARALGRPVVVYAENETSEDLKMMEGSDCFICNDFVSSIYRAAWIGAAL